MSTTFDTKQRELLYQAYREAGMMIAQACQQVYLWDDTSKTSQLVEFVKIPGKLRIILLPGKREEVKTIVKESRNWFSAWAEILEYQLCNGWDRVDTSQIALWDSNQMLLSEDMDEDDHGNITRLGICYTYDLYAIRDELKELLREGFVDYTEVDLSEDDNNER